ncbi:MAG: tyrosine-type recombinase/integrase [Burkholderiales bacterium]|nr:tyrosine-type recombinase/integrase [Burkholderiales bacterium]
MALRYHDPHYKKLIFDAINRCIFKITPDGIVVFDKTKKEMAIYLAISQATLKKYLNVWAEQKNMPYRFFNSKIDKRNNLKNSNLQQEEQAPLQITPTPTLLDIMSEFKPLYLDCKISNNLSKHTIDNINLVLDRFYDYIVDESTEENELLLNDMSKYFLSNYLNRLTEEGISKNTQKLYVTIIKNFFKFVADYDINAYGFLRDKFNGIKIKTAQKEKVGLLPAEQMRLITHLKTLDGQTSYLPQRNALLIKILLYTGLRISELINVKWTDLSKIEDKNHGTIYSVLVTGKGSKERFAYISAAEVEKNLAYLQKNKSKNGYLFVSTHGNKCNRTRLYVVIKKIMHDAGITKAGLHIFRHTFARNMVDKDINLATIKDLLGHSNIAITAQFYAKSNENAKRNALFK